ncbi:MAG TPA: MerR family transcriptional regulator [Candidatus Babeliales bacterium]|nr:MerR family transcriptional regulator [Candidatus Babeliales bacterium]
MTRKQGYFSISAVAKMFSVHQQTIRLYEKEGLINPKRSTGNTRMFSEEDVNKLEEIIYLTHQLGINLAGVEMIFKLQKQIKKMQKDMNKAFKDAQEELTHESDIRKSNVQTHLKKLAILKSKSSPQDQLPLLSNTHTKNETDWEIEYDE